MPDDQGLFARIRAAGSRPVILLELFVFSNLAFLVIDILVAHSVNDFAHWAEWIPLVFGAVGSIVVGAGLAAALAVGLSNDGWHPFHRVAGEIVGWAGVAVGISGLIWHVEGHFFQEATLRHLVYAAPFAAPLAFAGLGLLLLMNRRVTSDATGMRATWARWVLVFALGGFVGNFLLSLADHAQNGFFHAAEWIAVVASALGVGCLTTLAFVGTDGRPQFLRFTWSVLTIQVIVGVAGFAFHVWPVFAEPHGPFMYRVIFGAPVFAPLLFVDLAVLAALGLWALPSVAKATMA